MSVQLQVRASGAGYGSRILPVRTRVVEGLVHVYHVLPCAGHSSKSFACVNLFALGNSPMKELLLLCPFYRRGN